MPIGSWPEREPGFSQDWTFAALYTGFMAVPKAANGKKYQQAMLQMAKKFNWQPGPRVAHADDQAIGQTYLELYFRYHDPAMMAPIRQRMDAVMALPDDPEKPLWWWCDALFMAPPVLAKLSRATGDRKYLDFMDHEWWITSSLLYSPSNHLFFRDKSFLDKHEANGSSSSGRAATDGSLPRWRGCWPEMPPDYPSRPKYVAQFKEMAGGSCGAAGRGRALAAWTAGCGGLSAAGELRLCVFCLWRLHGESTTAFWIARNISRCVQKAWQGLLSHIYEDGRLGCIQPIGAAPGDFTAASSYVFGTGAFLLAGSEVYRLAH